MMQVFDNLRAILTRHKENMPVVTTAEMLAEIDEAEAKFGGHAICYFDCPCEYQNEDINVAKVDEHYKKIRAKAIDEFAEKLKECVSEDGTLYAEYIDDVADQLKEE